ncbi:amino acid/amide ABC transporter ATP-binding protein 1, HAAT family (TC 3.A.1.4.-) [Thermosyntropha lipolytica DSM 11003]|uniref:Amino acid/amide ABC transporter ATP-binding protein 1, HAAT family (TC 3.A.1.4.-) n=1 Tax=Thermosyntropha lipolytica DSM 11003 TaxID=1123382 RepID=A0A1M5LYM3_9FIRM|nr:ABC transporter ATP-binding protein [Thermosyntropha lipolytica]SHG70121.1 amino acid/amide ABC transporter ATP-binding protein 1, HAAT family (TC 3.A.1.4.-) [Thermosyntropha lipolytica DSM 11003]
MPILKLEKITQEFGGLRALDSVDLEVREREIFGVIGPNGAGKTTLFNIITGIYVPTEGDLLFKGKKLNGLPAHKIASLGIARTFQNIRLFGRLSVEDNVKIGSMALMPAGFWSSLLGLPSERKAGRKAEEKSRFLLKMLGLYEKRKEYASSLAYGEQRKLEIARALALEPSLLLLDEPAAGMNPAEKDELMDLIRRIRDDMGITILLVEHDMHLVMNICERIAAFDYGRKIAEGSPDRVKNDERVIMSYLGDLGE